MHLTPDDLVDLAEGTRQEASAPHLLACEACRRRLADLRATMSSVAGVEVPEPSPLFWDHFSARVHEAVAAERSPARSWLDGWFGWRLLVPVSVAGPVLALLFVALSVRLDRGTLPQVTSAPHERPGAEPAELSDDPALDLVADLSEGLDWEGVHEAGFVAHSGEIDAAVLHMSEGERRELQRLLKAELARSGA